MFTRLFNKSSILKPSFLQFIHVGADENVAHGGRFWRLMSMDELTSNCFVPFVVCLLLCSMGFC